MIDPYKLFEEDLADQWLWEHFSPCDLINFLEDKGILDYDVLKEVYLYPEKDEDD